MSIIETPFSLIIKYFDMKFKLNYNKFLLKMVKVKIENLIMLILLFHTLSCSSDKNFDVIEIKSEFKYKDKLSFKNVIELNQLKRLRNLEDFDFNQRLENGYYFILKVDIINNSKNKIEFAEICPRIHLLFNNKTVELTPKCYNVVNTGNIHPNYDYSWKSNEVKIIEHTFFLNLARGYKPNIFAHKPKKIELILELKAKNSVGFNNIVENKGEILLVKEITKEWIF